MPKPQFYKMSPVLLSSKTIDPEGFDDFEEPKSENFQLETLGSIERKSLLTNIIETTPELPKTVGVEVKWNSFTKIKRKNYLE